ncbi:MAG: 3-oxoacyl-ACP reductase family protein [Polaromonas sp.]|nr:3-oxoacyl-ACP reductase family protein [Polaromonas sp.]
MAKRIAYVTGGMGGIGTAICQRLHKDGFTVVAGCGPTRDFTKWIDEQKTLGYTFHASAGNVGDWNSTVAAFDKVKAEHGPVSVLVNNAGITRTAMLHKMTQHQWDQVLAVHLSGSFNCLQAVVGGMMERQRGWIINTISTAGILGTIGQINYGSAKAGLIGFTKSAARELARYNIIVNCVAPGAATPMTETIRTDERFKTRTLERIPLGRWAEPEELAPVWVFLASEGASYVTGQLIGADGGMSIH